MGTIARTWTHAGLVDIGDHLDVREDDNRHLVGTVTAAHTVDRRRHFTIALDDGRIIELTTRVLETICTLHI